MPDQSLSLPPNPARVRLRMPENRMDSTPVIGIVGGMGPAAGFDLAAKITRLTRATGDADHLPVIVMSLPADIPDRTGFLLHDKGENPGLAISTIALRLAVAGATVAGVPCNTAHAPPIMELVMSRLEDAGCSLRMVNMIHETVSHLRRTVGAGARVGVLSTSGVRQTRLYSLPLGGAGYEVIELDEDDHTGLITEALYSPVFGLKAVSPASAQARERVLEAVSVLAERGAAAVVLGCTELPLAVTEREVYGASLVDPTEILARALIRETYPHRLLTDQS